MSATTAQLAELQTLSATLLAKVSQDPNVLGAPVLDIQNVVKTSVIVNTVISPSAIVTMQQGGALQSFVLSSLALLTSFSVLLA